MTRNTKIALASLGAVVLIAGAFLAGWWLDDKTPPKTAQATPPLVVQASPPVQEVSATELRLGADAEIEYVTYYSLCGHKVIKREPAGTDLIGKSRDEIAPMFADATITGFTKDCVTVEHSIAMHCPQHYILKRTEQGLGVYQTALEEEQVEVASFPMEVANLSEEIQQMLNEGMVFTTLGEIEAYLEDLDS